MTDTNRHNRNARDAISRDRRAGNHQESQWRQDEANSHREMARSSQPS